MNYNRIDMDECRHMMKVVSVHERGKVVFYKLVGIAH